MALIAVSRCRFGEPAELREKDDSSAVRAAGRGQRLDGLLDLVGHPAEALVAPAPRVVEVVGGQRRCCPPGPRRPPPPAPRPGRARASGVAAGRRQRRPGPPAASSRPNSPSTKVRAAASGRSATTYSCWSAVAVRTRSAASMCSERSRRAAKPDDATAPADHLPSGRRVHLLAGVPPAGARAVAVQQFVGPGRVDVASGQPLPHGDGEQPLGHRRPADVAHADVQDGERRHSRHPTRRACPAPRRAASPGDRALRGPPAAPSPVRSTIVLGTGSAAGPASR